MITPVVKSGYIFMWIVLDVGASRMQPSCAGPLLLQ